MTSADATLALAEKVRAMLRLLTPDHLTLVGKRQIERVLDEHVARVIPHEEGKADAVAENDAPAYTREDMAQAWEDGNDAGYSDGYSDVEPSRQAVNPYRDIPPGVTDSEPTP